MPPRRPPLAASIRSRLSRRELAARSATQRIAQWPVEDHVEGDTAEMVALPGGWLVPAATVVQCGWRDVLGDLMRSSAWSEPEPLAEPEPVASLPAPSIAPSAARTRGLRNAPLAAQRPQTAAASPAASSSTIHGTDKVPLSHVQSSSSPIMTRPDLEPPCAPGNPSSRSSSASTLSAATLVMGPTNAED